MKISKKHEPIQLFTRRLLGLLFIISAILKLISPQESSSLFDHFLPSEPFWAVALTIIVSCCELFLGLALAASLGTVNAAVLSCLFFLLSTMVGVALINNPIDCRCFGTLVESKTDEFFLLRNFSLLGISFYVLKNGLCAANKPKRI